MLKNKPLSYFLLSPARAGAYIALDSLFLAFHTVKGSRVLSPACYYNKKKKQTKQTDRHGRPFGISLDLSIIVAGAELFTPWQ